MAWLTGWSKRQAIMLTGGSDGSQVDFQLKLTIAYDSDMLSDFSDLRFTDADGTTLIDAWLEDKTDGTSADVVVEFPSTPADGVTETKGYMYYGKADALSDWDIGATFLFGDDFESLDWTNNWQSTEQDKYSIDTNRLHLTQPSATSGLIQTKNTYNNVIIDVRYKIIDVGNAQTYFMFTPSVATYSDDDAATLNGNGDTFVSRIGGTSSEVGGLASDTWYRAKLTIPSTGDATSTIYSDDMQTTYSTKTGTPTSRTAYISFLQWNGSDGYVDDIRVRKYAANPPTYEFGSEENAPSGLSMAVVMHHLRQMRRS